MDVCWIYGDTSLVIRHRGRFIAYKVLSTFTNLCTHCHSASKKLLEYVIREQFKCFIWIYKLYKHVKKIFKAFPKRYTSFECTTNVNFPVYLGIRISFSNLNAFKKFTCTCKKKLIKMTESDPEILYHVGGAHK